MESTVVNIKHLSMVELEAGLPTIQEAPKDHGILKAIVTRPEEGRRVSLQTCALSATGGMHGDRWAKGSWMSLPDGRPHSDVQVTIMNARVTDLIANGDFARWPLAGDNLYVDLDLSNENLKAGQRLAIGSVILEITAVPHNGCKKFTMRYGKDAVKFVNTPAGKALHLRGIHAKVVQAGALTVGDSISKIQS